jgi:transposase
MALAKEVIVKESVSEIKQLLKLSKPLFHARLRMLLTIKKSEKMLSKNELSRLVHCSATSIQTWRNLYIKEGISGFLSHSSKASRPSIFTSEEHVQLETILKNPKNGFQGYKELHRWVIKHFKKEVKVNSLMVYCRQKFGTKIKVARKSHVKKDDVAVETFKKTLVITKLKL